MRVAIGSDHAGFDLKSYIVALLEKQGHSVTDVGVYDTTPSDYPDAAEAVAQAALSGNIDRAILLCGSGVGACVAANKVNGVRAGLCHDTYSAHQGVEHDDMNVLVIGARIIGEELAQEVIRAYLAAKFSGEERHVRRLKKVASLEQRFYQTSAERKIAVAPMPMSSSSSLNAMEAALPVSLQAAVDAALEEWTSSKKMERLWNRDATVWTDQDEAKWLGWLGIAADQLSNHEHLTQIAAEMQSGEFQHILLLGMGGSSLAPEVMTLTFGKQPGYPELLVLDSTDPAQVQSFANKIDPAKTLFIVSSKSGSTLEPNIFHQFFYELAEKALGAGKAGQHFVAITDPGSKMQKVAEEQGFRHVFFGLPSIGGRYSALSDFGMVPASAMGVDVVQYLQRAQQMVQACSNTELLVDNPGFRLGSILGSAARAGRDKVTIIASHEIYDLGAWLEQLLAESTGKKGKGLIPVDREHIAGPSHYGQDRVFAYLRLKNRPDPEHEVAVSALEQAGHPVVRIVVESLYHLGQEMFRWEIATAVAGSIIEINAFDQPDVEASKIATKALTTQYEEKGSLPPETPFLTAEGFSFYSDEKNAAALAGNSSVKDVLNAHVNRLDAGDYFAVLGYVQMNAAHEELLQKLRHIVRDRKKVATCLGFGPRFLHSTGQAYKGGPNSGVFLQITCDDAIQLKVPEQKYTFGVVKAAQARGDFQVLVERNRRALRVHLGTDVDAGLRALIAALG